MIFPELLLPAGDPQKLRVALRYGADAVYAGVPQFSLRTKENLFTEENIGAEIEYTHSLGKKIYITLNGFPHQYAIEALKRHIAFLRDLKPDGFIIADPGVLMLANEIAPEIPKHLSVQTSTVNIPAIKFWQAQGICRIILAREIALSEVTKIHEIMPEMELEIFVHGSVCMAYSGRCLLSNFMTERDSNRGSCAHSCRWKYRIATDEKAFLGERTEEELENPHDMELLAFLEEETRPGEIMPIEEDMHGTHIMSSRDMCLIEHLGKIVSSGVVSLKVEGRNKTPYYVAVVARAYRQALENLKNGVPFDTKLMEELTTTANRGFFEGFLNGVPGPKAQQYEANRSTSTKEFCGIVMAYDAEKKRAKFEIKNRIEKGSQIEFLSTEIGKELVVKAELFDTKGNSVDVVHGGAGEAWISIPESVELLTVMRQEVRNPGLKKQE